MGREKFDMVVNECNDRSNRVWIEGRSVGPVVDD